MALREDPKRIHIGERQAPVFKKYLSLLSDLQNERESAEKFFEAYKINFFQHIQAINDLSGEIETFIDTFESLIEKNRHSKEESNADLFGIELSLMHEVFMERMKIVAPVLNMAAQTKDMLEDIKFVYEETKERSEKWQDFILKIFVKK